MKIYSFLKQVLVFVITVPLFLNEVSAQPSSTPRFLENKGQILDQDLKPNSAVKYLMPGPGKNVQLLSTGFSIDEYVIRNNTFNKTGILLSAEFHFQRSDIEFTGINPNCEIIPEDPSADYLNYYNTGNGERGITHVRGYGSIRYKDFYHGIDLIFLADNYNAFSFHFVFKPGSEKEIIKVRINNIEETLETLYAMSSYRDISQGSRTEVGTFDELLSNPERVWGTYYGGSNTEYCLSNAIDQNGNIFLGGSTFSVNNIATSGSHQSTLAGSLDVYLAKFDSDGTRLWGTYYGGASFDHGGILLTDFIGNIYIHGETESTSGIATSGAHQAVLGGGADCFLAKFTTDGLRLWGTYYGGSSDEEFGSIALSPDGRIAMAGRSNSTNNISSSGAYQVVPGGGQDSFLAVFNSDGVRQWGTYYGGSAGEDTQSCSFDLNGNVFLSGMTESISNISTPGSHQSIYGGGQDAFLVKFNSQGNRQWGTYYGGGNYEKAWCCTTDLEGNIFLSGASLSQNNISTPGAYQEENHGSFDSFLVKFTTNGNREWGTYQGGSDVDEGMGVTIDMAGNIFLAGTAFSADFPVTSNAFQTVYGGNVDAFLSRFNPYGQLTWSTYYGGGGVDAGWNCKIDTAWHIYFCGQTESTNNISTPGSHQPLIGGLNDGFLVKFRDCQSPLIINNPADTLLCEGDIALFQVGAFGTSLAYQWQEDAGSGYNDLTNTGIYEGVNSAQLHINGIMSGMNGYTFRCVISGNCSPEAISESAVLEVIPQPVPSIFGPSAACLASSGNQYTTEMGMANYFWEVSSGGQIVSGEGTSSINVTWNADGVQTVYVGYTGLSGCNTVIPSSYDVTVYPSPPSPYITANGNMLMSNSPDGNQWYYEGVPVANATAPTYFATQTGWYWDVVTLNGCPSDTSNNLYVLVMGLSGQEVTLFSVYPSPSDGIFYIAFSCPENQTADISVFNILGNKIIDYPKRKGPLTFKVDISNEPAGVYLVVFRHKEACMVKKILVK